ncbi:hypothetical protein [[Clostridium] colinum]|uniref:hypothetical protein n=1 Tax=[Clostridium] colinum TaxID=36835 RepID=UPI0020259C30|nr:hypothetical protein [[Clostridium] colinum]
MINDKKEFYRRLAENSLKDVRTRRNIKTTRTNTSNQLSKNRNLRNTTKNGMIRFDEQNNEPVKSKFFIQCIICVFIIAIFYYLSNSNSSMANDIIEKTKIMIDSEFNFNDKINNILSKFNITNNLSKKGDLLIEDKIIEQMEEEIENTPKK